MREVTETFSSIDLGGISVVRGSWTAVAKVKEDMGRAIRSYLVLIRPASLVSEFRLNFVPMPRILPRLLKALQRPPGPFEDEIRIAPGLRSKARRKTRGVLPHKKHVPIRVTRPAAEYGRSLLLDEESQVKRKKTPPPMVKYQGQDGARVMDEDELRWWSNPYRTYVTRVFVTQ